MVKDLVVILLAGGSSRRMGRDKALLDWQGKPLLRILIERFKVAGFSVLVAGGSGSWAKRLSSLPAPVVTDLPAHENFGPLAGIEAGLLSTKAEKIGVVACDLPYAEPKLIAWLAEKLADADAVIPLADSEPQPLHAVYSRTCLPKLVAQLESNDKSVKAFLRQLKVLYVPEAEWQEVADSKCLTVHLNEPEDLKRCQESGKQLSTLPVISFVGFSGSGKTTVIEQLTKLLAAKGYKVGIIKHHAHADEEGKDTWRFQRAGSEIVGLVANDGMALLLPERYLTAEQAVEKLLRQKFVDLVLIEGFKVSSFLKIIILPPDADEKMAQKSLSDFLAKISDKTAIIGIISSVKLPVELPQFAHDDIHNLCSFIEEQVCSKP